MGSGSGRGGCGMPLLVLPIFSIPALPRYHLFGIILITFILLLLFEARFEKLGWGWGGEEGGVEFSRLKTRQT